MWASFYHWESFRFIVLHKVRKSLPGIQKSSETSRCRAPRNQAKWAETCKNYVLGAIVGGAPSTNLFATTESTAAPANSPSLEGIEL